MPSTNAASCDALSRITPLLIGGHRNAPCSSRFHKKDASPKQQEKHHNAAEEGDTANIKQNTTNKGYFHGRRMK
jgi:hypothetical protein